MTVLQNIIFPDSRVCTEYALYYHMKGIGGYSSSDKSLHLNKGATALFDTYFNLFSVGKWSAATRFQSLYFAGEGKGRFELRLLHAIPDKSWEMLYCDVHTYAERTAFRADLSHFADNATQGVIVVEINALDDECAFYGGYFETDQVPRDWPRLAISITTFKREEAVRRTVSRLDQFLSDTKLGDRVHTFVVDNGRSAEIESNNHVTLIENQNLGGAGGFARGLLEAQARDFTHCLFMDDDASFHMENIYRTYIFLALATESRTAVAGAMINNSHKWRMWENGAIFDRFCHPQFIGTDLRLRDEVFRIEFESASNNAKGFYGGWWYFAFPLEHVEHFPYPFFVRGDDISFSIANDFRIHTLNGITSFQDDFTEKESPLTLYLDLRGHLLHHMLFEKMELSPIKTIGIAWRFIWRSLMRFHYETAEAQLLSLQDVIQGPSFFTENIDMGERRQIIKELAQNEIWHPIAEIDTTKRLVFPARFKLSRLLMLLTFNGHLLPFSSRWLNHVVVPIHKRGVMRAAYGATQITYLNLGRDKGYTVIQSKRRFFGLLSRFLSTAFRFVRSYPTLKQAYREAYPEMTSESYWKDVSG